MDEGDLAGADPGPRVLVDQVHPRTGEPLEGRLDVTDGVGNVMEPGPVLRQEPADRRLRAEWGKQLDVAVADIDQHRLDALFGHRLAMHQGHSEDSLVQLDCAVQVVDCNANVIYPLEHRTEVYWATAAAPGALTWSRVSDLTATYLGHATTEIEGGGTRLLTDPLLRPSLYRLLRRRHDLPPVELRGLDAVLISHVHHDHLDLPSLRRLSRQTPIVVPRGARGLLDREGFTAIREVAPGDELEIGALRVCVTPAVHAAERRGTIEPPSLGYLVSGEGAAVYFAGDTEVFDGMAEIAEELDLALLPIWGWGPTLGPGHMNPIEAASALRLLRPKRVVPIHWGTYTPAGAPRIWPWMSRTPAVEFTEYARRIHPETEVAVLAPGESISAVD
jgi:L-ascorbate metabolism protein UlaG (beta-lactamase superfamily)